MNLEKAPDTEPYLKRLVSDCGTIEMGLHPVMFGWRVCAGYVGTQEYHLNWCCGHNEPITYFTYAAMRVILENSKTPFKDMPRYSDPKPWYKDVHFRKWLKSEIKPQPVLIKILPLNDLRRHYFNTYLKF